MSEKIPASEQQIADSIYSSTREYHFMEIQRRREEAKLGWFVASAGTLVGTFGSSLSTIVRSDERFVTSRLKGSARSLNYRTLISTQSLVLPTDTTVEGIDAFFEDFQQTPGLYRKIGFVSLNEPGFPIFNPIKTEAEGYIATDALGEKLAALGIANYLNTEEGIHSYDEPIEEVKDAIKRTYERLPIHRERSRKALHKIMGPSA